MSLLIVAFVTRDLTDRTNGVEGRGREACLSCHVTSGSGKGGRGKRGGKGESAVKSSVKHTTFSTERASEEDE